MARRNRSESERLWPEPSSRMSCISEPARSRYSRIRNSPPPPPPPPPCHPPHLPPPPATLHTGCPQICSLSLLFWLSLRWTKPSDFMHDLVPEFTVHKVQNLGVTHSRPPR